MEHDLLFYATADDKYLEFALTYPIFALASNPDATVEIGIVGKRAERRLRGQYGHLLEFYQKHYPNVILFRSIKTFRKISPNSIRFIIMPKTRAKYVYIGDIDIMITEPVLNVHLEHIAKYDLDFSNIKRVGRERLTGLHFIEFEKMYPARLPLFSTLVQKFSDEELLMILMRRKGYKIPDEKAEENRFRPEHGVHASWFNRAPLPTLTTRDEVGKRPPCWVSCLIPPPPSRGVKYAAQYLDIRYSYPVLDFMRHIHERDIALRRLIQVVDMVCDYVTRHYA
jgi:hypothetical protein